MPVPGQKAKSPPGVVTSALPSTSDIRGSNGRITRRRRVAARTVDARLTLSVPESGWGSFTCHGPRHERHSVGKITSSIANDALAGKQTRLRASPRVLDDPRDSE